MKKSAENEKMKMNASQKESENSLPTSIQSSNVKWFRDQPQLLSVLRRREGRRVQQLFELAEKEGGGLLLRGEHMVDWYIKCEM